MLDVFKISLPYYLHWPDNYFNPGLTVRKSNYLQGCRNN